MTEDASERAPLSEEAQRLFGAVQDWARRTLPPPEEHSATCQWCPLCSFVAVLRGERPEVSERVAEAGAAVASAVRALFDAARADGSPPPPAPRVEHIDLADGSS